MTYFSIDGVEFPGFAITSMERSFSVLDGSNSGRSVSGEMIRDVIGTYYNYKMELLFVGDDPAEYDALYERISAPVDSHKLVVPYAQNILSFDAYITSGKDTVRRIDKSVSKTMWEGLSLSFVAMAPERTPE